MKFSVEVDMEDFAGDGTFDEIAFVESVRSAVENKLADRLIQKMITEDYRWYHGDLKRYTYDVVTKKVEEQFMKQEFIDKIKQEIEDSIAEKLSKKKWLAESQFSVEKFADLSPSNRKYLLGLVEEVMVKRLKGLQ